MLFMPVRGGPSDAVTAWMEAAGGELQRDFTQNSLRTWLREHPRHRSFTVLRHPLLRGWDAFRHLLGGAPAELRQQLRDTHRVPLPADDALFALSVDDQVRLFGDFLGLMRRCLNGQTSLPILPYWASQTEVLSGFSRFLVPDFIMREATLERDLCWLAEFAGLPPLPAPEIEPMPDFLNNKSLQQAARAAWQRDYLQFGFSNQA